MDGGGMELWDAGTTAFWACVVAPGHPHECTVPPGLQLRLKGACVALGAKRKAASTLTVSAEDDSTASVVARLSISGERDFCVLKHVVSSGVCVLTVSGTAAVHVTGHIVQTESQEELTEDNTEGLSFVDPNELEPQREPGDSAAESESESDGLEEVVYDTASMDADGGGDSDQDSLDDDTGTVDYSDAEYSDEDKDTRPDEVRAPRFSLSHSLPHTKLIVPLLPQEEPADSPSKSEREELALDTVAETGAGAEPGDEDQEEDEAAGEELDDIYSLSARQGQKRKLEAQRAAADAKRAAAERKRAKKQKPEPVYDMTPGPAPSKSQKTKANKLLKQMKTKASGLQVYDKTVGKGAHPKPWRKLRCHYKVRLDGPAGKLVQHSGSKPFEFRPGLREVIKGWDEGVVGMRAGGQRMLLVPPSLGYGKTGVPPMIPPDSTLFFEIELL